MPPLGRITESLGRGEYTWPFKTAQYSIAGVQKIVEGVVPAKMVSNRVGVERFGQYAELSDDIDQLAGEHAHSLFAETFSSQLQSTLADTEALGALLDETVLAAGERNMPTDNLVRARIERCTCLTLENDVWHYNIALAFSSPQFCKFHLLVFIHLDVSLHCYCCHL